MQAHLIHNGESIRAKEAPWARCAVAWPSRKLCSSSENTLKLPAPLEEPLKESPQLLQQWEAGVRQLGIDTIDCCSSKLESRIICIHMPHLDCLPLVGAGGEALAEKTGRRVAFAVDESLTEALSRPLLGPLRRAWWRWRTWRP